MKPDVKSYEGNSKFIFISYSHNDDEIVYPFIAELQKKYNVWFDEGIHYGSEWRDEITERIEECSIFIFMVTNNSLSSKPCKKENMYAVNEDKNIIYLMLEKIPEDNLPRWFSFESSTEQNFKFYKFRSIEAAVRDLERKCIWFEELTGSRDDGENKDNNGEHERSGENEKCEEQETPDEPEKTPEELCEEGDGYLFGNSDELDDSKAVICYRKAAEMDYAEAQFSLGNCYYNGTGVPEDKKKAFDWYLKAAKKGHTDAQCLVGFYYETGEGGVGTDIEKALKWYKAAAESGDDMAIEACARLAKKK